MPFSVTISAVDLRSSFFFSFSSKAPALSTGVHHVQGVNAVVGVIVVDVVGVALGVAKAIGGPDQKSNPFIFS